MVWFSQQWFVVVRKAQKNDEDVLLVKKCCDIFQGITNFEGLQRKTLRKMDLLPQGIIIR